MNSNTIVAAIGLLLVLSLIFSVDLCYEEHEDYLSQADFSCLENLSGEELA